VAAKKPPSKPAQPAKPTPQAVNALQDFTHDRMPNQSLVGLFLLGMTAAVVILIAIAFFKKPPPIYLPLTPDGQITRDAPLDKPNLPDNVMLTWVNDVVTNSLTFNFKNVQRILDRVRPNYTSTGYAALMAYLTNNNILADLQQQKWVENCFATSAPQIQDTHVLEGRYVWTIQMPVHVQLDSVKQAIGKELQVTITLVRVPTLIGPMGFQIDNFTAAVPAPGASAPLPPSLT